jgi:hypothetical protein
VDRTTEPRILVKPAPGVSPEAARNARARVWCSIFTCFENAKAAGTNGGEDAEKEIKHDSRRKSIIPG